MEVGVRWRDEGSLILILTFFGGGFWMLSP